MVALSGGALFVDEGATVKVVRSEFTSNAADRSGGAIYVGVNSNLTIDSSNLTINSAVVSGGAMQVADVHKALLSLSRCADMGFESRFGSHFGCLVDTQTGEVIPMKRQGNLYILRAWIRAAPVAPFGRQDGEP